MHLWESIGFRVCHRQSNNSSNAFICTLSTDYKWFAYFVVRISVTYCISCLRMERRTFGTVSGYQWFLKFLYNFSNISQVWRQPRCHPGKIINGFVNRFITTHRLHISVACYEGCYSSHAECAWSNMFDKCLFWTQELLMPVQVRPVENIWSPGQPHNDCQFTHLQTKNNCT